MYRKISEPLVVIGSALKTGVSKQQLKEMVDKMKKNPEIMKDVGKAVSQGKSASDDVTAGLLSKYGPIVALILALAAAAHADPKQVGNQLAQADNSTKVEQVLDSLLNKVDMPDLVMKGKADLSKVNQALNDKAFQFDTRVGPTGQSC